MARSNRIFQGLSPNTRYSVRVRAVSKFGVYSDWSEALDFITPQDTSVPNPPSDLSVDFETETLFLGWTGTTTNTDGSFFNDFKHYRVELTAGSNTVSYVTSVPTFTYSFRQNRNDFGIAQPAIDVQIFTVDASNASSDPLSGTAVNVAPPKPDPMSGSPTPNGTNLVLDPVGEDIDKSIIERGTSASGPFSEIAQTSETIYFDEVDDNNLTYHYRYKTVDVFGQESPYSDTYQRASALLAGPTIVIAAAQAPDGWKQLADFVCDGLTDAQTILDAVTYGNALEKSIAWSATDPTNLTAGSSDPGYGIQFSPGTFLLEKNIDMFGPTLWEGVYASTVLVRNYTTTGSPVLNAGSGVADSGVYDDHVLFRNLVFNGNNEFMENNAHPAADMMIFSGSGGYFENCGFVNCSTGLYIAGGLYNMTGCWFDYNGLGLWDNNNSYDRRLTLTNCRFTGNGSSMYTLEGAVVDNCQFVFNDVFPHTNTFTFQGKTFGIYSDSFSGEMIITNSQFYENSYEFASIILESRYFTIDNCSFHESSSSLAESIITSYSPVRAAISNCVFEQDLSSGTDDAAIRLWNEGKIDVRGCTFNIDNASTSNIGILISKDPALADPDPQLNKVKISECTFYDGTASSIGIVSNVPVSLTESKNVFHSFFGTHYNLGVDTDLIAEVFRSGIELPENFSQFILTAPNGTKYNVSITNDGTLKSEAI